MTPELWIAWCPKCGEVRQFGAVYRNAGWPFCSECKVTDADDPRWPGTPWKWVPPENGADGVMRVWADREESRRTRR